jgi:hypothetical protein
MRGIGEVGDATLESMKTRWDSKLKCKIASKKKAMLRY